MLRSIVVLTLCTGAIAPLARSQAPAPAARGTFTISGDPESADGATWTFQGRNSDETVPVDYDERFAGVLLSHGVPHELYLYPGGHLAPRSNPLMFERVRAWYQKYGMFQ